MSGIMLDLPWRGSSLGGAGCLIPVTEPELADGPSNGHAPSHGWLDVHGLMIHKRELDPAGHVQTSATGEDKYVSREIGAANAGCAGQVGPR